MDSTTYIESYLNDTLTPEEKSGFEQKLIEDPSFLAAYEAHKAAYGLIKAHGALTTKAMLSKYENKKYGRRDRKNGALIRIILSAAAVAALIVVVYFLLPTMGRNSTERLFAAYYTPYRDPVSVRGNEAQNDIRSKANDAYRAKDFEAAMSYFSQLASQTDIDKFYYGLSAIHTGETELAITLFEEVARAQSDYKEQAAWYLALAYIRANKTDEAKKILTEIQQNKTFMHEKAMELFEELR